jgi:hypothetical protein
VKNRTEGDTPPPQPAEPKVEPLPTETISREQLERDTYDIRKKSSERLVNVSD